MITSKRRSVTNPVLAALLASVSLFLCGEASASLFDAGIPVGWTGTGNFGVSGANGDVSLAPSGGAQYGWVSTAGGKYYGGLASVVGSAANGYATNGSVLQSNLFTSNAGQNLHFAFNYVTSDGAGYADYAWARLLNASLNEVAVLFTARTTPSGDSVPGYGMPAIAATITPGTVVIAAGAPKWSPLGGYSGTCYDWGCGNSGWVTADYSIAVAGNYYLEFGVTNWKDRIYDSGLAFDSVTIGGKPIVEAVPEPASIALLGLGLVALGVGSRRKFA